ncbi:MAG: hypothetical protein ACFE8L_03700 [Candidatus Hodarchaeota archaeon]
MRRDVLTLEGVNINNIIKKFVNYFNPSGKFTDKTGTINVFIIEKYYFRAESILTSMVIFEQKNQNTLIIHLVVSGGGLSIFSGNAKKSLLKKLKKFFLEH